MALTIVLSMRDGVEIQGVALGGVTTRFCPPSWRSVMGMPPSWCARLCLRSGARIDRRAWLRCWSCRLQLCEPLLRSSLQGTLDPQPADAGRCRQFANRHVRPATERCGPAGWESLIPDRFELEEGAADVRLGDGLVGLSGSAPGLDDTSGVCSSDRICSMTMRSISAAGICLTGQ